MNPKEKFDQALKTFIRDPYHDLLSFSIDSDGVTLLQLQAELLRDETMFESLLHTLRTDLPTHSLYVSLQPHSDYNADERFARLQHSLQDSEGVQITLVSYQENGQEKGSFWKSSAFKASVIGASAFAAPIIVAVAVTALGFTPAGIPAGSGAKIASTVGAMVGAVGSKVFSTFWGHKSDEDKGEKTEFKSDNDKTNDDEEDKI